MNANAVIAIALKVVYVALLLGVPALSGDYRPRNTTEDVRYVGSQVCAGCHRDIYSRYSKTAMGRSVTRPSHDLPLPEGAIRDEAAGREFRVYRKNGELYQSETERRQGEVTFEVVRKLEYAIGSGQNGITFVVQSGNSLFQAPLSWYSRLRTWDLSPGFAGTGEGFGRPIHEACIACHSGRPRPVARGEGQYLNPPFAELPVNCEKCHGPGELHVRERQSGRPARNDTSIVNPARLPSRLAEDICMQCHQGGDARVLLPGKSYDSFRPGKPLSATLAIFEVPHSGSQQDLLEHHSSMTMSKCYRASSGKLGCLSCHTVHSEPQPRERAAWYAARCLSCHNKADCLQTSVPSSKGAFADCTGCHMPKRDVKQISHSALTDHRIPARPGSVSSPAADVPGELILLDKSERQPPLPVITQLSAYGELQERYPQFRPKYLQLLERARTEMPEHPLVLAALGRKALVENSPEALAYLLAAEKQGIPSSASWVDLSEALVRNERQADAVSALERGSVEYPYAAGIQKRLILGYIRLNRYTEARTALDKYVETFPEDSFMRGLLSQVQVPTRR